MKEKIKENYKDSLLNIYDSSILNNCPYDYVVVLNEGEEKVVSNIMYTTYDQFYKHKEFEFPIPAIRKAKKLLTYQEGLEILQRVPYGVLSITNDIPYCIGVNYILINDTIYIHTGYDGYKLQGLNKLACFHVIEDLGIHQEVFTHNHASVTIYGKLEEVKENKKDLLQSFLLKLTPDFSKEISDSAAEHTNILKLTIKHMSVKKHYH